MEEDSAIHGINCEVVLHSHELEQLPSARELLPQLIIHVIVTQKLLEFPLGPLILGMHFEANPVGNEG